MEENKEFEEEIVDTIEINGKTINVYIDDYGQCYYIKWLNDLGEECVESCGTYNTDYEGYIKLMFDPEYKYEFYRSQGIILATDRYMVCKEVAKLLHDNAPLVENTNLPFRGQNEDYIFRMLYGSWKTKPEDVRKLQEVEVGHCPVCDAGVNEYMNFCMNCGNKIEF